MAAFKNVPEKISFPKQEHEVIALWEQIRAFERSVEQREAGPKNDYVFYDGPPFATGLPHYGHFVASTLKDVVPRYWTMRGKRVERRFGWDTHGLPIEMEIEKALGLSGPSSIREYGIGKFNEACRATVLRYTGDWRKTITRLGRWVDFDNDYKTMDPSFMESVWWAFSKLWEKGLVYQGFRVMPFSWRLSTPLSNFEANSDYRSVQDPAITVRMSIDGDKDGAQLLVWTTTPWTLPSNVAVAVGTDVTYVRARKAGESQIYVVAKDLLERTLGKDAEIVAEIPGSALLGLRYQPLLNYFADLKESKGAFVVVAGHHVTTEDGTGLVHMAPAFGQDDYDICQKAGLPIVDPVDEEGNFTKLLPDLVGQNIKEADPKIIRMLKEQGSLFKQDTIQHSYPFCWRSGTPLIYKAVPNWFVKVTAVKDKMVEKNKNIHWVPEAVGDKRFGNWLLDAQDWSISRSRFWGTPIPVWICKECKHMDCVGSVAALEAKTGAKVTDLHSHFIDPLTYACSKCGSGEMKRIPEVFDCWFDSGSMPYAQSHYPFENKEAFEQHFPAQFIAEGLDQTRAWFYTLLVLSTILFDKEPFQNVVVNGLVLAEDGSKMSKSKRNYPDPNLVLENYGADALRAYLINSPVVRAEPLAFSEAGVRDVVRSVMLPLYNSWSFFVQYANIDGWDPKTDLARAPKVEDRPEIDRWVLSKLQSLLHDVNEQMEGYYLYKVIPPTLEFIDDLTNWYIRRSRRRFWKSGADADKMAAYATMYEVLTTFSKMVAPVLPFISEQLYQNLVVQPGMADAKRDSVHLCDYPVANEGWIDRRLEADIDVVRRIVRMGRALREKYKIKTRQPLRDVTVVTHDAAERDAIVRHQELIAGELNVKNVIALEDDAALCELTFKANFKTLGKRMGARMKEAAEAVANLSRADFAKLQSGGVVEVLGAPLQLEDVLVNRVSRGDVVVEAEGHMTVALETELDDALIAEGLMRETVSLLQKLRKDMGLAVTDRVQLHLASTSDVLLNALRAHQQTVADEVLALAIQFATSADAQIIDVDGHALQVSLSKV